MYSLGWLKIRLVFARCPPLEKLSFCPPVGLCKTPVGRWSGSVSNLLLLCCSPVGRCFACDLPPLSHRNLDKSSDRGGTGVKPNKIFIGVEQGRKRFFDFFLTFFVTPVKPVENFLITD